MRAGRLNDAGDLFAEALGQLHKLDDAQSINDSRQTDECVCKLLWEETTLRFHPLQFETVIPDDMVFRPLNCTFLVSAGDQVLADKTTALDAELTAFLIYNIAVCYQTLGFQGYQCKAHLHALKVLELYEAALSLLESCYGTANTDLMLPLAILNNKGCVLSYFHDFQAAQVSLGSLKHLLDMVVGAHDIRSCDILELQMNVALIYVQYYPAAAA